MAIGQLWSVKAGAAAPYGDNKLLCKAFRLLWTEVLDQGPVFQEKSAGMKK